MLNEELNRNYSCCFTGHRPRRLHMSEAMAKCELEREIRYAINDGYTTFITGMAQGIDTWAAELVLKLKEEFNQIRLVCAIPFKGFYWHWAKEAKDRYNNIVDNCDEAIVISNIRGSVGYYTRDKWMVDHSNRVIAVFNGEKSGTGYTIEYANSKGVDVTVIEDK